MHIATIQAAQVRSDVMLSCEIARCDTLVVGSTRRRSAQTAAQRATLAPATAQGKRAPYKMLLANTQLWPWVARAGMLNWRRYRDVPKWWPNGPAGGPNTGPHPKPPLAARSRFGGSLEDAHTHRHTHSGPRHARAPHGCVPQAQAHLPVRARARERTRLLHGTWRCSVRPPFRLAHGRRPKCARVARVTRLHAVARHRRRMLRAGVRFLPGRARGPRAVEWQRTVAGAAAAPWRLQALLRRRGHAGPRQGLPQRAALPPPPWAASGLAVAWAMRTTGGRGAGRPLAGAAVAPAAAAAASARPSLRARKAACRPPVAGRRGTGPRCSPGRGS